jgi:hypothetical protein
MFFGVPRAKVEKHIWGVVIFQEKEGYLCPLEFLKLSLSWWSYALKEEAEDLQKTVEKAAEAEEKKD